MRFRCPPAPYPCEPRAGGKAAGDRGHAHERGEAPQRRRARRGESRRARFAAGAARTRTAAGAARPAAAGSAARSTSTAPQGRDEGRGRAAAGGEPADARRRSPGAERRRSDEARLRAAGRGPGADGAQPRGRDARGWVGSSAGERGPSPRSTRASRHRYAQDLSDAPLVDVGLMACGGSCAPRGAHTASPRPPAHARMTTERKRLAPTTRPNQRPPCRPPDARLATGGSVTGSV